MNSKIHYYCKNIYFYILNILFKITVICFMKDHYHYFECLSYPNTETNRKEKSTNVSILKVCDITKKLIIHILRSKKIPNIVIFFRCKMQTPAVPCFV